MNTILIRSPRTKLLVGLLLLLPGITMSAARLDSTWTCTSGELKRKIALVENSGPAQDSAVAPENTFACRVEYSKNGESEVLWLARNNPDFCRPKVLALVNKLRAAGFKCQESGLPVNGPERSSEIADDSGGVATPPTAEQAPQARSSDDTALRGLLERYYEDFYLDAMVAVIPAEFTVGALVDAVSTESGAVLYVAPPNHFVKTLADGSYVLVNTLVLQHDSKSSFVNLGFVVKNNHYSFLGYAIVHVAVEAKVTDADTDEVTLMATTAATASCEGVRRTRALRWVPDFAAASSQPSGDKQSEALSGGECAE
jgi:hypothetical protein